MRRIGNAWRVIESVLREHVNTVFKALRPPASESAIAKLTAGMPCKLPNDFLRSLRIHDGVRGTHRIFNNIEMLSSAEILSWWRMQWNLQCECEFPGCQFTRTRKLKNDIRWRKKWIPFMQCEGDHLVLDLDPGPSGKVGQVFAWYNYGGAPMRVIADSFSHWLDMVAEELDHRRFELDEWGGICLKKRLTTW